MSSQVTNGWNLLRFATQPYGHAQSAAPSLATQMVVFIVQTVKALNLLPKDADGFFLMVEEGQVEWAGHSNDVGHLLHQLLKFDESVWTVYHWVKDRTESLVAISGNHATGGPFFLEPE